MGLELQEQIIEDLKNLRIACESLDLLLPNEFIILMSSPEKWKYFRSTNDGFFDLRTNPIKSPISNGFLVPFISDSQYTHFYYLHLTPNRNSYEVVWSDDICYVAMTVSLEEFEEEYKEEFNQENIFLCDDDFEHFMFCHLQNHEKWFSEHGM